MCHTRKYRSVVYNECDLKLRLNPTITVIPVVFHNLTGCDSHVVMQAISQVKNNIYIRNNTHEYISLGQQLVHA